MRYWIVGYLLLGAMLLVPSAAALLPDQVTVTGSPDWVVAGGSEGAAVTVTVLNDSLPIQGLPVTFGVETEGGSIVPGIVVTDAQGRASAMFTPGTVSGTATITARVEYPAGEAVQVWEEECDVNIDHAASDRIALVAYTPEVAVGETTTVTVRMVDRYGNIVDNRNTAETVLFTVGSADDDAGFLDGGEYVDSIRQSVDAAGNATVTLKVDRRAGENLVLVDPPSPVPGRFLTIYGVANGVPATITHAVTPSAGSPPYQPADGVSKFSITYTLFDQYGNPAGDQPVMITTSLPEEGERLLTTNGAGQVTIGYGPKETTGTVTITATAAANSSVTVSQPVEFTSTDPVNMLLTASPQNMPSRDVKSDSTARIRAKVMDIKGNPVFGETVTFTMQPADTGVYLQTEAPSLVSASALTNGDGYADIGFRPGAFTTDRNNANYSATATGTCEIVATWGTVSRTIPVAWKNYPYLSVETSVSPETVAVNETIDVTVLLRGDGWALQPDPIDVMLCTDRSGSMLKDYPDRMVKAMGASTVFNAQMNYARDRMGLVSFGKRGTTDILDYYYDYWLGRDNTRDDDLNYKNLHYSADPKYYAEYAVLDLPLSSDPSAINTSIEQMVPESGTPMRYGIYKAINELKGNGSSSAVKAVIVLSDGDYNYYGDPLARGTGYTSYDPNQYGDLTQNYYAFSGLGTGPSSSQNMSVYAMSNSIRIYSIAFAQDISSGGKATLRTLAESAGGKYYEAPTGDELAQIYIDIAGELKTEAGVNTRMDICFENVEVNETLEDGANVFDYVYVSGSSTRIFSFNDTAAIIPEYTRDDTLNWTTNHALTFDIGTVKLNQTWEATFRLKVLTDGNINIFGPGSTIAFNDGAELLELPDLFVTAIPDLNNTGVETMALAVDNLRCTGAEPYLDMLPVAWDLNYTGAATVSQAVSYSKDGGNTWICFDTRPPVTTSGVTSDSTVLDVRRLPPGEYLIRVHATSPDTPDARAELVSPVLVGSQGQATIRIR